MANDQNDFAVSYGATSFFSQVLSSHSSVRSFSRVNDIQFLIARHGDHPDVNAVLADDYMLGEAKVYAIIQEFRNVTAVVNNGTWNHVVLNWRDFARRTGVVVLGMTDFMGALNVKNLAKYTPRDEREERRRKGRKSS